MKKNKIFNSFENDIPFEPNYSVIKNKIEMNQYTKKETKEKRNVFYFRFAGIMAVLMLVVFGTIFGTIYTFSEPKTKYIEQRNIQIYDHDKEFVDNFENVFIGKVIEEVETKQYDGTGMDIPYTFFKVEQIHVLKGEQNNNNNLLCFFGGYKNPKKIELFRNNNELIKIDQYYLFFVNNNKDDSSRRIQLNNYILSDNNQKILLENYDETKELTNQNKNILTTINRYKNVIDKKLGNEVLGIPEFQDKKEIYNSFTYASIIKVNGYIPTSTKGDGIYSEIVSSYYSVEILVNFKEEVEGWKKNLYCYGTNFWENENLYSHFVNPLEKENVYLLLANECLDNESNSRINIGDFVVMDDYQLIELDDYQINKSYEKQSDLIKEIVGEYIN